MWCWGSYYVFVRQVPFLLAILSLWSSAVKIYGLHGKIHNGSGYFEGEFGTIPGGAQGLLFELYSGLTPGECRRSYGMLAIEPESAVSKANALLAVLSLWSQDTVFYSYSSGPNIEPSGLYPA